MSLTTVRGSACMIFCENEKKEIFFLLFEFNLKHDYLFIMDNHERLYSASGS